MCELIVITGPTAVGKTELSLQVASALGFEVISADSRQVYREMRIGTAVPTEQELRGIPHHMLRCRSIFEPINAYDYEQNVLSLLPCLFSRCNGKTLLVGGSMMYIDAVCHGIDEMPTITDEVRQHVLSVYESRGLEYISSWLARLDPEYHKIVDLRNPRRLIHAIEICLQSGITYTSLRAGSPKSRPFKIKKFAVVRSRDELYARIESRVDQMISEGLLDEVESLIPYRHLNTLNTVGYRELFDYFDGKYSLDEAIRLIKRNTRHYAKKQLTWIASSADYTYISPTDINQVLNA